VYDAACLRSGSSATVVVVVVITILWYLEPLSLHCITGNHMHSLVASFPWCMLMTTGGWSPWQYSSWLRRAHWPSGLWPGDTVAHDVVAPYVAVRPVMHSQ
jgi:hypothetical protein